MLKTYLSVYMTELLSAAVLWLPAMALAGIALRRRISRVRMVLCVLFASYLTLVLSIVGFPRITELTFNASCNFVPLVDIVADGKRAVILSELNIDLFIPFGMFVPLLWEKFRSFKHMALLGFSVSLFIEVMQLFTFRSTDVDDLIMNTLGTLGGYLIMSRMISLGRLGRLNPDSWDGARWELPVISGLVLVSVFFVQPYVEQLLF